MVSNTPEENNSFLAAALEYAAKGIPVFPCLPYGKKPATPNGFKDRSLDPAQIEAWWTAEPQANIGIVPADQGLAVIDLDGEEGLASWQAEYDHLCPLTRTHRTPSGGLHLFYTGTVRPTANKLGPGIDTRGEDSYVLVPPSVVRYPDGTEGQYTIEDDRKHAALSECIDRALASIKQERKAAPPGVEEDSAYNVAQAIEYLTVRAPLAIEGAGGDQTTYTVAAGVRDYGISEEKAIGLMSQYWNDRCSPPWDREDLAAKVAHAYSYAQNEAGNRGVPKDVQDAWIAEAARLRQEHPDNGPANDKAEDGERVGKFSDSLWPDEAETMPELDYWDDAKLFPKVIGGATVILYGKFGTHKTNVTLSLLMDCILGTKKATAVFAAGEGAHGVGKLRIPAHCRARGIATKALRGKLLLVPAVPLLANNGEVAEFIEAVKERFDGGKPNIAVLDTLSTAIAGEEESGSRAAQFLTGNGTVGLIRRELGALVILPAHEGKGEGKSVRGNSGFGGNADVLIHCEADKDARVVKLTVEKMRDGPDGHSIYFAYEPEGVPVPVRITKEEYEARVGKTTKASGATGDEGMELTTKQMLVAAGAWTFMDGGRTDRQMAEFEIGPLADFTPPLRTDDPDNKERQWRSAIVNRTEFWRQAHKQNRKWALRFWQKEVSTTSENAKAEVRWSLQGLPEDDRRALQQAGASERQMWAGAQPSTVH